MSDIRPELRKHPTHKAVTIGVFLLIFIVVVAVFIRVFMLKELEDQQVDIAIFVGLVLLGLAWMFFRISFLRCAACGRWLRSKTPRSNVTTRKFHCPKCHVLWDSGCLYMVGEGD